MANQAHYIFALGVATGMTQTEAYKQAYPGVTPETAQVNSSKLMKDEEVQMMIRDIHEADERDTRKIRAEIIQGHLADMRNDALSPKDRRAARIALARMMGMETQVLEVKCDTVEEFARQALARASAEPLVKG